MHAGLLTHRSTSTSLTATVHPTTPAKSGGPRFYIVRPGDSLSAIAAKTGVPLSVSQSLNPGVNPTALQAGAAPDASPMT